jgi:RHS repeat-associated protein
VYLLTNTAGARRSEYRYRAYGDRYVTPVGEAVVSPFGYKAREEDRETGLVYLRHRYYSPRLERFVNEDPIGIAGGLNTYAFGAADPINRGDPLGLCGWEFQARLKQPGGFGVTTGIITECVSDRGLASMILADFWREFTKSQFGGWTAGGGAFVGGGLSPFGGGGQTRGTGTGTNTGGGAGTAEDDDDEEEGDEDVLDRILKCAAEHYGLNTSGLVIRGASGLGALRIGKPLLGLPPVGGHFTNPISALRLVFGDVHLSSLSLGTKSLFGIIGRANAALFVGILAYDATSIAMCAF